MKRTSTGALAALKEREEAKREAYLRRRFSPAERWRWQQAALAALAQLRPDLERRRRPPAAIIHVAEPPMP